jgi:hypothetical protein
VISYRFSSTLQEDDRAGRQFGISGLANEHLAGNPRAEIIRLFGISSEIVATSHRPRSIPTEGDECLSPRRPLAKN